ncbi:MAG: antibiotic biosynthesis monooxygenase [Candidatus Aminicenantaceae bacterium]
MFARTLRIQTAPDQIDTAAMLFEESVIPLCKNQKGFVGSEYLADRHTGVSLVITIWESEADLQNSERSRFFQEQVAKFIGYFTAPPIRESFEVVMLDLS